jgi:hypothetical protein
MQWNSVATEVSSSSQSSLLSIVEENQYTKLTLDCKENTTSKEEWWFANSLATVDCKRVVGILHQRYVEFLWDIVKPMSSGMIA